MSLSSLSFPFDQNAHENIILNRLILTDKRDYKRLVFSIDQGKCSSIEATHNSIKQPISYIDSSIPEFPLLVRCDASLHRLKLLLLIKSTKEDLNKSLVIVKARGHYSKDDVQKKLTLGETPSDMEVSRLGYLNLPLDDTEQFQKININDSYSEKFHNGTMNVFLFCSSQSQVLYIFGFLLFITQLEIPDSQTLRVDTSTLRFSDYRSALSFVLDDGPEFRKILGKYEDSIPQIQKNNNLLIDEVKSLELNFKRLSNNKKKMIDIIEIHCKTNPLLSKIGFETQFKKHLNSIFAPFEKQLAFILTQVFEKRLLDGIKSVSTIEDEKHELTNLRKTFDHESKEYYNWLKKYLSNEKDRPDLKLLLKRKRFELSKFDYLNYLNGFSNNQYVNQLLENLFKFVSTDLTNEIPKTINKQPIPDQYRIFLDVVSNFNADKFKLRQMIEGSKTNDELTGIIKSHNLTVETGVDDSEVVTNENLSSIFSPITPQSSSFSQSSPVNSIDSEKSGMLYALGGKGKQGWHKEWVVVKAGELKEYSDWRTANNPINTPIQIALANVKPTSHEKRQHCFEIFTSKGQKYVFQAMNEQERDDWIKAIDATRTFVNTEKLAERSPKESSKISRKLHLKVDKPKVIGVEEPSQSPVSIKSSTILHQDYFKAVRSVPGSDNHICADCGSLESVEWISLNLLMSICINCSSCHRSLGSHISKVKSLKLDNFTRETEFLLNHVNNRKHNSYLETKLDFNKLDNLTYDERLEFIKNKYINKKFASPVDGLSNLLFKAIRSIDVDETIKYVLLGADINSQIQLGDKQKVLLFEYSLRKYLILETTAPEKIFVLSEYLALNGARVHEPRDLGYSSEALEFWNKKYLKA